MNNTFVWLLSFILPRRYWYRRFYLRSKHWRNLSKLKREFMQYRCENCRRIDYNNLHNVDAHHLWYYDTYGVSILFRERLSDLQVLCRKCHQAEHKAR
jgi:5-methylcytosine-specific restriction endonuclease McrA